MQVDNYTESDLRYLQEAIAAGELKSKHQDRYVEYRDLDEMLRIEQRIIASLQSKDSPSKSRVQSFRLNISSGL